MQLYKTYIKNNKKSDDLIKTILLALDCGIMVTEKIVWKLVLKNLLIVQFWGSGLYGAG